MQYVPLDEITLKVGGHANRNEGVCLMEAAAWYAGEPHTDRPECVCTVLGVMGRNLNDALPDDLRIRLLQFVPRVVGTAGDGMAEARDWLAMDWVVRTYTPTWLRLGGFEAEALRLKALPAVESGATLEASMSALQDARKKAAAACVAGEAARVAAWEAAGAAARAAAWVAAWAATGDAARAAAWVAAGVAAGAAAKTAAGAAAKTAARAAARAAAWAATGDAAGDATGDAAGDAARAALASTVRELQIDSIRLYGRMVALRPEGVEVEVPEPVILALL